MVLSEDDIIKYVTQSCNCRYQMESKGFLIFVKDDNWRIHVNKHISIGGLMHQLVWKAYNDGKEYGRKDLQRELQNKLGL